MGNHALTTLLAWPYPGRERLPAALIARLTAAGLLPLSDTPGGRSHHGHHPTVLAGDSQSGPILAGAPAQHGSTCGALIAALAASGLHVYVGRRPAGGYCASWEYHPPGEAREPVRHRCCDRNLTPSHSERDPDEATECELNRWRRLVLGSPAGVPRDGAARRPLTPSPRAAHTPVPPEAAVDRRPPAARREALAAPTRHLPEQEVVLLSPAQSLSSRSCSPSQGGWCASLSGSRC